MVPLDVEGMAPRLELGGEPVEIYGTEEEMTTEDLEEVSADDILERCCLMERRSCRWDGGNGMRLAQYSH